MDFPLLVDIIILVAAGIIFAVGRAINNRLQKIKQKKQMSMMFTSITHELLTPLTIISASVDNLRDEAPQYSSEYDLMEINIQRSVRLLQQVLETAKSQNGKMQLLVSQGDVMAHIQGTARTIIPLMAKKGLKFTVSCVPENMMGWFDIDKLDKIIFNLLSNAAKYTNNENGEINLNVRTNDRYNSIIIEVRDNGDGIPKSRQKHLFEMFYDGEYRKYNTMGNGIGLALTKNLVTLHGGTISYESEEGKGCIFTIVMPINKDSFLPTQIDEEHKVDINIPDSAILDRLKHMDESETDSEETTNCEEAYKILIVEDNLELLNMMREIMKRYYIVTTASNGREALDILKKSRQDLILSDVMMPEMDGYQLTENVKTDPDLRHLPIILLTARTQEEDRETSLRIGADGYITKPFKMKYLRLRIDNLIENRKRIQRDFKNQSGEEAVEEMETMISPEREFLDKAMECLKEHLSDSDYGRDSFARDMGMSQSSLYNKLRAVTGVNVSNFIRDFRIQEACRMMKEDPNKRISEIAYSVGYRDPKYFATTFKKVVGVQPSEYTGGRGMSSPH